MDNKSEKIAKEKAPEKIGVFKLFKYAQKTEILLIIVGLFCSAASGAAMPIMSFILSSTLQTVTEYPIDVVKEPENARSKFDHDIKQLCLYFVYLAIATFIVSYFQIVTWMVAGERMCLRIRSMYFRSVSSQEMGFFDVNSSGDISSRISSDVNSIQEGVSENFGQLIQYHCSLITGIAIALARGWKLALVMMACVPLIIGSVMFAASFMKQNNLIGTASSVAQEVLGGIKTVIAFGGSKKESQRYEEKTEATRKVDSLNSMILSVGFGFMFLFLFCTYSLGFWYGTTLILEGDYDIGKVTNVFFAIVFGSFALAESATGFKALTAARVSAIKVFEIIERKSDIDSTSDEGLKPENIQGYIEFKNVTFRYPARQDAYALKDLSLKVPAGKTVAFVGSSGSGKSTSIQLIERFYDPESGIVELDSHDLRTLNVNYLRNQIGLVGQEPILFATTIFQNVAWGMDSNDKEATLEQVIDACKLSNAHDFIMGLPNQYDTIVGDKGSLLSGGQKQRISIARSIIKNPRILLLDEATSALDTTSERTVQEALDKASINRTTIIVAHRLSTIKKADIIYVMDKGEVIEAGSHQELSEKEGMYYNLMKAQEIKKVNEKDIYLGAEIKEESVFEVEHKKIKSYKDTADYECVPKQRGPFNRIIRYALRYKFLLFLGVFGTLMEGAVFPVYSLLITKIITRFAIVDDPDKIRSSVDFWCVMFLALGGAAWVSQIGKLGIFELVGQYITKDIRNETFRTLLKQEASFFDFENSSVGILTTKLNTEADQSKAFFTNSSIFVLTAISGAAVAFGLAFSNGWKLSLALLACMPAVILANALKAKISSNFSKKIKEAYEKASHIASESVLNIKTVVSLTREETFCKIFEQRSSGPHKLALKSAVYGGFGYGLSQSLNFLFNAVAYYYGSRLVLNDNYSIENMTQVIVAILFYGFMVGNNAHYLNTFSKGKIAAESFFELVDRIPKIQAPKDPKCTKIDGNSTADNVHFSYPTREDVKILEGLSLDLPSYKNIALVGPSGCGKSTLISLLQRLYDTNSGNCGIEGINVKEWDLDNMRSQMSIVGQEPVLFDYTIAENISYGKEGATMDEIIESAKLANAHNFIMDLSEGYDTRVGERGGQISGGQKQRIAIARALIRNPPLLLLDEATSALDSQSEKLVQEAIDNAASGRTSISIAHRLSSIQNCDLIIVLKAGKLIEYGNHSQLMNNRSVYFDLAHHQNLS